MSGPTLAGSNGGRKEISGAEDLPSLYIASPSRSEYYHRLFGASLRNLFVPFPDNHYEPCQARNIPDTRNSAVSNAIRGKFDLHMQVDEDQTFEWDFFLKLYGGIKEYGENTIVTGWSICKSGTFERKPSVYRTEGNSVVSVPEVELQTSPEYIEVDSFGSCGFLAPTSVFDRIKAPWFTDINLISEDKRVDELYVGTEFAVGQDIHLASRLKQAGVKVVCATKARMGHLYTGVI